MKNRSPYGLIGMIAFLSVLNSATFARQPVDDYRIVVTWSAFGSELEAALVVPNIQSGVGYILTGSIPGETPDGSATASGDVTDDPEIGKEEFTITRFISGTYQILIKNKFIEESFGENDLFGTAEDVFVNSNACVSFYENDHMVESIRIQPDAQGIVWLAAEIDGSSRTVTEVNRTYPRLRAIYGSVIDAVTGDALDNALVIVKNRDTKETVGRAISDTDGQFVVPVDHGRYTVYIGKKQYISDRFDVDVLLDFPSTVHAVLTKIIPPQDYRIVLTWGRYPVDVDAHLRGPHPGHEDFHIYWNRRTLIKGKKFLDRDDTSFFGPETITIYGLDPGAYRYTVHNYSGRHKTNGDDLSRGNVTVKIYNGDQLLKEYHMPPGTPGNYWKVFEIDGETGQIRDINQTGFESDPERL
ncbi:MAG: carboxypeptidase regulatory-like domain-containing protein [Fidelibacterota bacterium]